MNVVGIMSGTSLDGVDLACVTFTNENNSFGYKVIRCETIPYNDEWKNKLKNLIHSSAEIFACTHVEYGHFLSLLVNNFIKKNKLTVDLISSHGHTVFHQPVKGSQKSEAGGRNEKVWGFTSQIGDGATISAITKLPVACDFRSVDVALEGQGAPLVPVGDSLLFSDYNYCLNLGGIANISAFDGVNRILAFDICPVNMALNYLCNQIGFDFDEDGKNARQGKSNTELFEQLNLLPFYKQSSPKSLGAEWFEKEFKPLLDASDISISDKLNTVCQHAAYQISQVVLAPDKKMLVTGGGAHNSFLMEKIKQELSSTKVIIPDKETINFKEAIVFAFLGYLRVNKNINSLRSVTGAQADNCGGAIYDAFGKLK